MLCHKNQGTVAGIGLGIVRRLAAEGAKVMVSSRRQQNVDETVAQLRREGFAVAGCVCHVGNPEHIKALVEVSYAARPEPEPSLRLGNLCP